MKLDQLLEKNIDFDELAEDYRNWPDNQMPNEIGITITGTYLGFSIQSIIEFIDRTSKIQDLLDKGYSPEYIGEFFPVDSRFSGTGFVPSEEEIKQDADEVIKNINKRRFHHAPFHIMTDEDGDVVSPMTYEEEERLGEEIYETLKNNMEFQNEVIRNIEKVQKVYSVNFNLNDYRR